MFDLQCDQRIDSILQCCTVVDKIKKSGSSKYFNRYDYRMINESIKNYTGLRITNAQNHLSLLHNFIHSYYLVNFLICHSNKTVVDCLIGTIYAAMCVVVPTYIYENWKPLKGPNKYVQID